MTNSTKATKREKQDLIIAGILAHPELAEKFGGKVKLDLATAIEDVVGDAVATLLLDGKKVTLSDVVTVETRERAARKGVNPKLLKELKEQGVSAEDAKAQATIDVAASVGVGAKATAKFKAELNA